MTEKILFQIPEQVSIAGEWETKSIFINGKRLDAGLSQSLRNHSPDGFAWGYGGSGPAQLSLAILLCYMPQRDALTWYQHFKFSFVSDLPMKDFEVMMPLRQIMQSLNEKIKLV